MELIKGFVFDIQRFADVRWPNDGFYAFVTRVNPIDYGTDGTEDSTTGTYYLRVNTNDGVTTFTIVGPGTGSSPISGLPSPTGDGVHDLVLLDLADGGRFVLGDGIGDAILLRVGDNVTFTGLNAGDRIGFSDAPTSTGVTANGITYRKTVSGVLQSAVNYNVNGDAVIETGVTASLDANDQIMCRDELVKVLSGTCDVTTDGISNISESAQIKVGTTTYTITNGAVTSQTGETGPVITYVKGTGALTIVPNGAEGDGNTENLACEVKYGDQFAAISTGGGTTPSGGGNAEKVVTDIKFVISGGGLTSQTTVTAFGNNDYLHKDGTVGSSSTDAVGQFKYNSTTDVITYTPTDKTKAQTIDLHNDTSRHKFNVSGTNAADSITGKAGAHTINGGAGNDTLYAGSNNIVLGEDGNDSLIAAAGVKNASLNGGYGDDYLSAKDASVTLTGGSGKDIFDISAGGNVASISDYTWSKEGEDKLLVANGVENLANTAVTKTDGKLTIDGHNATVTSSRNFYAVTLQENSDARTLVDVGWTKDTATEMNFAGLTRQAVLIGTTNTEGDSLVGGTKSDTIYAGTGDSVYGGAGHDTIDIADKAYGVYVGLSTEGSADEVKNFIAGWDIDSADAVYMMNGSAEGLKVTYDGSNISLKSGSATMTFNGMIGDKNAIDAKVLISGKKVDAIVKNQLVKVDDSSTIADYYIGTESSGIDASAYSGNVIVDLGTEMYRNITTLKAGTGDMSVLGGKAAESLIGGKGETSLYGGAGTDTLVSGDGKTTFFANESSGKDVVTGFAVGTEEKSDVINFNALNSVSRTDDTTFMVHLDTSNSLKVSQASGDFDSNIQWASGDAKGVAKIGKSSDANNFSYDDATTNYVGSTKIDTVSLASGTSDSFTVWLDQTGDMFNSIEVYDFSQTIGDVLAAGKADTTETVVGGRGSSSLWGGAGNTKDVLVNNDSSAITEFFYGMGDGNDVIEGQRGDSVKLYNLSLSDITKATVNSNNVVFTTTAKNTVTVSGGVGTFKLADGTAWTADYSNKSWTQK